MNPPRNPPINHFSPSPSPGSFVNPTNPPTTPSIIPPTNHFSPSLSPNFHRNPTSPSMTPLNPSINHVSPSPSPSSFINPTDPPITPTNPPTNHFSPSPSPSFPSVSINPPINPPLNPPTNHVSPSPSPRSFINPTDPPITPTNPPTNHFSPSPSPSFPSVSINPPINPPLNPPTNHVSPSPSPSSFINPTDPSITPISPPTNHFSPSPNPSSPSGSTNPSINPPLNPPINHISPSPSPSSFINPTDPLITPINPPTNHFPPSPSPSSPSGSTNPPINPPLNPPNNHFSPSPSPSSQENHTTPPVNAPLNPATNSFSPSVSPFSSANEQSPKPSETSSSPPLNPPPISVAPSMTPKPPTHPSNPPLNPPMSSSTPLISPISPAPNTLNASRPSGLQVDFYKGLCPNKNVDIEAIITAKVKEHFGKDPTLLPAMLRLQFHDCFVHGCDASILIDGPSNEKSAGPNLSVRGYEFIDDLKDVAEADCPDVVSCADIIAIATKELIRLGGGPKYSVQTGRMDGLISKAEDVRLPSPFGPVRQSILAFGAKNFTPEEMVVLFGCHTVGISNCVFFQDRLYEGTSQFDPNMDPNLRRQLIPTCPKDTRSNNFTFLDQNPQSSDIFDNSFFDQILKQRGILPIDQALANDPQTRGFVLQFARNADLFNDRLATVMVKLQALEVLTGNQGEIRRVCSKVN
ncbi:Peroxidase 57 [Bienertia sinuspersici]